MYERILDTHPPSTEDIEAVLGCAYALLQRLESFLDSSYDIKRELKFPFGKDYGWGYKYSHKSSHLCYVFFETGAFTVMLQLGGKLVLDIETAMPCMLPKTRELWQNRYPCGEQGGWVHYRVMDVSELADVIRLISIKKRPKR